MTVSESAETVDDTFEIPSLNMSSPSDSEAVCRNGGDENFTENNDVEIAYCDAHTIAASSHRKNCVKDRLGSYSPLYVRDGATEGCNCVQNQIDENAHVKPSIRHDGLDSECAICLCPYGKSTQRWHVFIPTFHLEPLSEYSSDSLLFSLFTPIMHRC